MDLLDFFRGKYSWAKFFRLAGALGDGTRFYDRKLRDMETAELLVNSPGFKEPEPGEIDFVGETREVEQLRTLVDLVRYLIYVTANNEKNRPPAPAKRPETAISIAMRKKNERQLDGVLKMLGVDW